MAGDFCDRLARLQANSARKWGRMTPHQMVCHLVDSFRAVSGGKPVKPAVTLYGRTVMKWGGLHLPIPWPHGIPTRPEMSQEIGGTPPADWNADCAELRRWIVQFPGWTKFEQHPMMGALTVDEWRIWGFRHVNHHFRQFGV